MAKRSQEYWTHNYPNEEKANGARVGNHVPFENVLRKFLTILSM
jgi:hypothetical protein